MAFVHGHARAMGWVIAHRRAPNRPEEGQLALLPALLRVPRLRRRAARVDPRSGLGPARQRTVSVEEPPRAR